MRTWTVQCLAALLLAVLATGCWTANYRIIAHRGAPRHALENSLEAFAIARDQRADGLELDVRLTADGRAVILHDRHLDRTTDCAGPVESFTLAGLSRCRLDNGEPLRTLEEVLPVVAPWFDRVLVDMKDTGPRSALLADGVLSTIVGLGLQGKALPFGRGVPGLRIVAASANGSLLRYGLHDQRGVGADLSLVPGLSVAVVPVRRLGPRLVELAETRGLELYAYGVNDWQALRLAEESGVTAMITDDVPRIRALTRRGR